MDKPSYSGNMYEQDFLQFLDTNDIFKYGKQQIMDDKFLKFEFFLDFYRQSMMWNKILFLEQKKDQTKIRRQLIRKDVIKNKEYQYNVLKMKQADEACLQDILDAMLKRIDMSNEEFQQSLMHHMGNAANLPQIQKARQDNEECNFTLPEGLKTIFETESSMRCSKMTKKEMMDIHKVLHDMSVDHMRALKRLPLDELQPELNILQYVLSDKLFDLEQIEGEDLDAATERIGLESDAEYQIMVQEYMIKVQEIKLG